MTDSTPESSPADDNIAALDFVSMRIAERYSHPARTAYLYLFRLRPSSDLAVLIPTPDSILSTWVDEGTQLTPSPINDAIAYCEAAAALKSNLLQPQKLTPRQRRQRMARSVVFTVQRSAADLIEVDLCSRALIFTPKGDRIAHEQWRQSGGVWYSAYQPQLD